MGKGKGKWKNSGSSGGKSSSFTSVPRGRSEELKNVEFSYGTSADAAKFEETLTVLVRFIGVQSWPGATEASLALEHGKEPALVEPPMPKIPQKKYKVNVKEEVEDPNTGQKVEREVEKEVERDEWEMWELKEKYQQEKAIWDGARML